ncbi:Spy/CpxP family protein refolding chaperone [Rosenbergiella australiborealis]|uniref:ATP-independent periplasmic protein-refolding chaperone n=1 Tax=Rosenbergiella australiborealis TaxID=1544696 RepID=A0ABS5T2H1_9GAMM|nr:Spy/CpxP family protein refolding chaperone [Rosenbergiella australiborealis]MBT0726535.1 ATP-independent periplasmic protein-refolding chaperone [Rosenbergiella australiborealis]
MRKVTSLLLASSLVMGSASLVYAETAPLSATPTEHSHMQKRPHGAPEMMLMKGIVLTDAQKQQIHTILEQARQNMTPPSKADRQAAFDLITAEKFDSAKAQTLAENHATLDKQRMLSRLETDNKIYNLLTADQKKQYQANYEKMKTFKQPAPEGESK